MKRIIRKLFYMFMAGYYIEKRNFFSSSLFYNPIIIVDCDLKYQKWEHKYNGV